MIMAKEEEDAAPMYPGRKGPFVIVAALFLALGMLGSAYLISQANFAPQVNVTGGPAYPNVYVSSTPPDHAISVSATAEQKVAPDLLVIQLRVQTESQNAKESQSENAAVTADLLTKLKAQGLTDQDIQTVSYSVNPEYNSAYVCDRNGYNCHYDSNLTGYSTVNTLSVQVYDLTKGGDIIDAAATAGTNQTFTDYVQFTLKDSTERSLEKSLLQNASTEAKSKAQSIASGLGVSLGNVLSASESYSYYPTYYKNAIAMESAGAGVPVATQLSPGQVSVSATVSTSFAISGSQ